MMFWLSKLLNRRRPQDFTFMGELYDGDIYEKVPDPSDVPPADWGPPGGDWNNWQQDMMVRRKR